MKSSNRILLSFLLNCTLTLLELIAGIFSYSSALVADSLNNLTDSLLLFVAYAAEVECTNSSKKQKMIRNSAAIINISIIFMLAFIALGQALYHIKSPGNVNNQVVVIVGVVAVIVNLASVILLRREKFLATKAALFSLLTSLTSALVVLLSGVFGTLFGAPIFDLVTGLAISLMLFLAGFKLRSEFENKTV